MYSDLYVACTLSSLLLSNWKLVFADVLVCSEEDIFRFGQFLLNAFKLSLGFSESENWFLCFMCMCVCRCFNAFLHRFRFSFLAFLSFSSFSLSVFICISFFVCVCIAECYFNVSLCSFLQFFHCTIFFFSFYFHCVSLSLFKWFSFNLMCAIRSFSLPFFYFIITDTICCSTGSTFIRKVRERERNEKIPANN